MTTQKIDHQDYPDVEVEVTLLPHGGREYAQVARGITHGVRHAFRLPYVRREDGRWEAWFMDGAPRIFDTAREADDYATDMVTECWLQNASGITGA